MVLYAVEALEHTDVQLDPGTTYKANARGRVKERISRDTAGWYDVSLQLNQNKSLIAP